MDFLVVCEVAPLLKQALLVKKVAYNCGMSRHWKAPRNSDPLFVSAEYVTFSQVCVGSMVSVF